MILFSFLRYKVDMGKYWFFVIVLTEFEIIFYANTAHVDLYYLDTFIIFPLN